jgi:hypothetical protein
MNSVSSPGSNSSAKRPSWEHRRGRDSRRRSPPRRRHRAEVRAVERRTGNQVRFGPQSQIGYRLERISVRQSAFYIVTGWGVNRISCAQWLNIRRVLNKPARSFLLILWRTSLRSASRSRPGTASGPSHGFSSVRLAKSADDRVTAVVPHRRVEAREGDL